MTMTNWIRRSNIYFCLWPKLSYAKQWVKISLPPCREALKNIVQLFQSHAHGSDLDLTIQVRNWVNTHSVHLVDDEHDSYAFEVAKVVEKLWLRSAGKIEPPHLSCGPRAYAMKEIVDTFGIESRIIDIFAISDGVIRSHTLLEVYDRQQRRWIMQDPDFNVTYRNQIDGRPMSALEVLQADGRMVEYSVDGYLIENEINCVNTIAHLFELGVLYRYSYRGRRSLLLWNKKEENLIVKESSIDCTVLDYLAMRDYRPRLDLFIL